MRAPNLFRYFCLLTAVSCTHLNADDNSELIEEAIFVLEQNCITCHNADDQEGEITLDRDPLGVDDPSLILEAIEGSDPKMPKDADPLLEEEIEILKKWIAAGAKLPDGRILKKPETD